MIKSVKIRLLPTKEQEGLMFKSIGCSRFAYNWGLNICNELYKQGVKYNMSNIRKEFTQLKKQDEYLFLNNVYSRCLQQSIIDMIKAYDNFLKFSKGYPKFKSKKETT
mgnify:CR=1 FL=1